MTFAAWFALFLQVEILKEERKLGTLDPPKGRSYGCVVVSPDGATLGYSLRATEDPFAKEAPTVVHFGNAASETYEAVGELHFSAGGKDLVYAAKMKGRWSVVTAGKPAGSYDEVSDMGNDRAFTSLIFRARTGSSSRVVFNGKAGPEFEEVAWPQFTPDEKNPCYRARRKGRWSWVIGEKADDPYDRVGPAMFSGDGAVVAYRAVNGGEAGDSDSIDVKGGTWCVVVSGKAGESFDEVTDPSLSRDGRTVVYGGRKGETWYVVKNGVKSEIKATLEDVKVSADASVVAVYFSRPGEGLTMSFNGKDDRTSGGMSSPWFAPVGSAAVYEVNVNDRWHVVWGGKVITPGYERNWISSFSPDGKYYAFVGENKVVVEEDPFDPSPPNPLDPIMDATVVVDGKAGKTLNRVKDLQWSPSGKTLVIAAWRGGTVMMNTRLDEKAVVIAGGKERDGFDGYLSPFEYALRPLRFSLDGRKVGFATIEGKDVWWRVMDVE